MARKHDSSRYTVFKSKTKDNVNDDEWRTGLSVDYQAITDKTPHTNNTATKTK